ncbi:MAG: hypothetical protein U0V56_02735 [Actinomycetota bacterium]
MLGDGERPQRQGAAAEAPHHRALGIEGLVAVRVVDSGERVEDDHIVLTTLNGERALARRRHHHVELERVGVRGMQP